MTSFIFLYLIVSSVCEFNIDTNNVDIRIILMIKGVAQNELEIEIFIQIS